MKFGIGTGLGSAIGTDLETGMESCICSLRWGVYEWMKGLNMVDGIEIVSGLLVEPGIWSLAMASENTHSLIIGSLLINEYTIT